MSLTKTIGLQADRINDLLIEIDRLREYIDLLENQVIASMTEDEDNQPIPYLPADPEEKRRLDVKASDGEQCMIYRGCHGQP